MPDLADVETGLVAAIAAALFQVPLATEAGTILTTEAGVQLLTDGAAGYLPPTPAAGPNGATVQLYRGWPVSTDLSRAVRAGTSHVSVFPDAAMARNTTRYLPADAAPASLPPPTLLLRASGSDVTVNGTPAMGQVCGLLVAGMGGGGQGSAGGAGGSAAVGFPYRIQPGDTVTSVAAALAALVPGASAAGAIVTLPTDRVTARVVQDVPLSREVRRQEQVFRVTCWCPTPAARDAVAGAVDAALAPLSRLVLAPGWTVYLRYRGTRVDDAPSQGGIYRRELTYTIEYPTTPSVVTPSMLFGIVAGVTPNPITV